MQIYEYIFFKLSKIEGGRSPPEKFEGGGGTRPPAPPPPGIAAYGCYNTLIRNDLALQSCQ